MPLNTTLEIYQYTKLDASFYPPSAVEIALADAASILDALAPLDDSERSLRMEPIRKLCEKNFCAAEIFSSYAVMLFQQNPPVRLLGVLGMNAGGHEPTTVEIIERMTALSDAYRVKAEAYLTKCRPINAVVRAGP